MKNKKIILIDGNSLIYRAFFALPDTMSTSKGLITNAIYGFTGMLIKLINLEEPDVLAVAFDSAKPTFRHEQFTDYKADRQKMPDELAVQFPVIKELLQTMEIPIFEKGGYEADDILATLAKQAENDGYQVRIVTGDHDAYQLISDKISIMTTKKGISDIVIYDSSNILSKYGVPPQKIPDFLGLKGDTSDNIPGIPGIGEKTAAKLLQEFDSLEDILDNMNKIKPARIQELIRKHQEEARLSKELAILDRKVPIHIDLSLYSCGSWDKDSVKQKFIELEFKTLLDRLLPENQEIESEFRPDLEFEVADSLNKLKLFLKKLEKVNQLFLYPLYSTDKFDDFLTSLSIMANDKSPIVILLEKNTLKREAALTLLKPYLEDPSIEKIVYQGKRLMVNLFNSRINLAGNLYDLYMAAYLLQPGTRGSKLNELARKYLKRELPQKDAIADQGLDSLLAYTVSTIKELLPILNKELDNTGLQNLFQQIEMPLQKVLASMETEGVGLDKDYLKIMSKEINSRISLLTKEIYQIAGAEFNLNSPQQVGEILFEKLSLPPQKKTKTGYSTDQSSLMKLIDDHPIISKIIEYRELAKLKTTYIDTLPELVNPRTGRLHTSFNQTGTVTGRLSSSNPNLQNIPIRTEIGRKIRGAFIPSRKEDFLMVADYSQIELRVMAHLSGDNNLRQAFLDEKDIHRTTAAEVFGIDESKVTPELRRKAKAVNFGIIYGISPYGLSEQLKIEQEEAKAYIDRYFQKYPKVKEYIDNTIDQVKENGFVTTLLGRRRYIPEIKSRSFQERSFAERMAINAPIQGSAADIIKIAMIKLDKIIEKENIISKMVLQVHDELVFEVAPLELDILKELVKREMEGAFTLDIPLVVDLSWGRSWLEAK